jgi:hypothetical protein
VATLPLLRMLVTGNEPLRISNSMRDFAEEFKTKSGIVDELILEGHDHLSPLVRAKNGVAKSSSGCTRAEV